MKNSLLAGALVAVACLAHADEKFSGAAIYLEQNVTDNDAEVVIKAAGGSAGLATLKVIAPDGRAVVHYTAPDSKLGTRALILETPEPTNDGRVQTDYPEGEYTFLGRTVSGAKLESKVKLSHVLPAVAEIVRPRPEEKGVPVDGFMVKWRHAKRPSAYIVSIEQEETENKLTARFPGAVTTFAVPPGFLSRGTEYKVELSSVSADGNVSTVETTFETIGKR